MNKKRKLFSIISIIVFLVFIMAGTFFIWHFISQFNGDPVLLKDFLDSFGEGNSVLIFLILQLLQIIFPILPGEVIELTAGYVFGPWMGLLLCEIGVLVASFPIFLLVRLFGQKILSIFFDMEKFKMLKFLKTEKNLSLVTFFLFFIPGTPKDLLTYFVGLTPIKATHFFLITIFARIPSILTSTWMGANLGIKNHHSALILYAIVGIISAISFFAYKRYEKSKMKTLE